MCRINILYFDLRCKEEKGVIELRVFGNILWVICGGAFLSAMWCIVGLICFCTIIAIPVGVQCFKFAKFIILPFGKNVIYSSMTSSFLLNLIWIALFGWELAIASLVIGAIWCITLVGIPFGLQFFKFAKIALLPFGAEIVEL